MSILKIAVKTMKMNDSLHNLAHQQTKTKLKSEENDHEPAPIRFQNGYWKN